MRTLKRMTRRLVIRVKLGNLKTERAALREDLARELAKGKRLSPTTTRVTQDKAAVSSRLQKLRANQTLTRALEAELASLKRR